MLFIVIQEPKHSVRHCYSVRIVVVEAKTKTEALRGMPEQDLPENKGAYKRPFTYALELGNEYHG